MPEIINGKGDGDDIPAGEKGRNTLPITVSNGCHTTRPSTNNRIIITK